MKQEATSMSNANSTSGGQRTFFIKWSVSLLIPLLLLCLPESDGMTRPMIVFFAITTWAVLAWALGTVNDVVVGLALPLLYILTGVIERKVAFSPWLSVLPSMVIGGLILGRVVMDTGLAKRIALWCVRLMGGTFTGALAGLTLATFIIAPFVPSIMGKAAILSVVAIGLCEALEFQPKSREASAVMIATFLAVASSKLCFLTGGGDVVLGMTLMGQASGIQVSWGQYAMHNLLPGLIYATMSLGLVILLLRPSAACRGMRSVVEQKYAELGPISRDEIKAGFVLLLTLILLATDSLHHISSGYVLLGIGLITFLPGLDLMDGKKLSTVRFGVIFFIVGSMSIGAAAKTLGVAGWLSQQIMPLFHGADTLTAMLSAYVTGIGMNFLLTPLAAYATFTVPVTQIALDLGADPRPIVYAFQYGLDQYLFPYEFAVLLYFFASGLIAFKDLVTVMAARMVLTALLLAGVAYPFWKMLELA
jgi:di/tricarboxylate transporter